MTREAAARILERIALLLELKGENPFKIRAYKTGAEVVESYAGDIMQLAAENRLAGIKGIGEALRDKLYEMATTGRLEFFEKLKAELISRGILEKIKEPPQLPKMRPFNEIDIIKFEKILREQSNTLTIFE